MKHNQRLVSVVMPAYNSGKFLKQAIESIINQSYTNFEYIIIDDGSTDNSLDIIKSYSDKRIRIILHTKNEGIVSSLNAGIIASKGKYIARMDADDVSSLDRLAEQVSYMEQNPKCGVVGSFVRLVDENNQLLYTVENPARNIAIKKFLLHNSCLAHGSVLIRKKDLIKAGLYDKDEMVRHAEDYDLFTRMAVFCNLANIPEYLYTRHEHKASISRVYGKSQSQAASYISQKARKSIILAASPSFSIIMPTYNKAKYIKDAIESVISQTHRDWELIIIDDNSTDNTEIIVKEYLHDSRIVYLKNPVNLGKARTRNRLVKESISDIFGELDSDDSLTPDAIKTMIHAHKKYPGCGFIYSQFAYCDEKLAEKRNGFCRSGLPGETNLHHHHASAFRTYKRKYFELTSGFDVNLSGAEDIDLIYKMEEVAPIHFVDKVLYKYRIVHNRNVSDTKKGLYSHAKAKYFAYIRRRGKGLANISLVELMRQIINNLYSAIKL